MISFDEEVVARYEGMVLGLAKIVGVRVEKSSEDFLDYEHRVLLGFRQRYKLDELKDDPVIRAYRDFYWRMGIDPTKTRPSSEALARRVLRGQSLPKINNVVDAYNLASMETLVSMGAYDDEKIDYPLTLRFAKPGEEFVGIGRGAEKLRGGELVLADSSKIINVYPYRDSEHTKVVEDTQEVLLVVAGVPGLSNDLIYRATEKACRYITRFCGGTYSFQTIRVFKS